MWEFYRIIKSLFVKVNKPRIHRSITNKKNSEGLALVDIIIL